MSRLCDDEDIVTPVIPKAEGHKPRNAEGFYNHISAKEIRDKISPQEWENYFKFTFEKNPWDKMVSWYLWYKNTENLPYDFKQFCISTEKGELFGFPTDYSHYTIDDKIAVDFIGEYESLYKDFDFICQKLGLPFDGTIPKEKSSTRKDKKHYSSYYDSITKKLIESKFEKEITFFDYKF